MAWYLAEIPQNCWHVDASRSSFSNTEADSPIFVSLARSFLSRAEGGGLGGRRTSVLRFPVYSQDGLSLRTLVCRPGVPSPKRSLGCFLFHEPSLKFFSRLALSSPGSSFWFLLLFSWTHSLSLANFKLACPLMRNSPAKHGLPGSGSACCHHQGLIVWQPSAILTELSHILPALPR